MGREIFGEIRDQLPDSKNENYDYDKDPHVLWTSERYVCGRDSATSYICARTDDSGSYAILEGKNLEYILERLKECVQEDHDEIDNVKARLERLFVAQKNARNYEEFNSFDDDIDNCREWLKDEAYSRAESLLALIDETLQEYQTGKYDTEKSKPYLVVSE